MRTVISTLFLTALLGSVRAADPVACSIDGSRMHWIADYCMAVLSTDDEIPASACIDRESRVAYLNDCAAKTHYKRAMCKLAIERTGRAGSVEKCVRDTGFVGPTVRNRGVGG